MRGRCIAVAYSEILYRKLYSGVMYRSRPQNTTAGRVWLYTLLYGNSLYRLYATAIHRYTSFTPRPGSPVTLYSLYSVYSYTAIHAIQHTAPYSLPQRRSRPELQPSCPVPHLRGHSAAAH